MSNRERRYASSGDYANFTGEDAPNDLDRRVLVRASRRIDRALIGAVYQTDEHGMPTDPDTRQALREATCAQVEWWRSRGDMTGTGVNDRYDEVKIADVSLKRAGAGTNNANRDQDRVISQSAEDILTDAGLLPVRALVFG